MNYTLSDQLIGQFIKTPHWPERTKRLGIQIEKVFHMIHEISIQLAHAPLTPVPRFHRVFFTRSRMVSSETWSMRCRSISCSASHSIVQACWPSGGVEQAKATQEASTRPVTLIGWPGRGFSDSANSTPAATHRFRRRSTVV